MAQVLPAHVVYYYIRNPVASKAQHSGVIGVYGSADTAWNALTRAFVDAILPPVSDLESLNNRRRLLQWRPIETYIGSLPTRQQYDFITDIMNPMTTSTSVIDLLSRVVPPQYFIREGDTKQASNGYSYRTPHGETVIFEVANTVYYPDTMSVTKGTTGSAF